MRIGIDARPLIGQRTGIGNYLYGLLDALGRLDRAHEFILYSPRHIGFAPPNDLWRTRIHRGIKGTNGTLWLQWYGRRLMEDDRIDLCWGAHFLLPVRLDRRIPAVLTIYDLVPFLYPQTMELRNYLAMRVLLPPSVARSQHIMAISHTAARDLRLRLRVAEEKISVVPPGVAPQFVPTDPGLARARIAGTLGRAARYVLAVGTVEPRKNLITLIRAFGTLPPQARRQCGLVIAGAAGWRNSPIHDAAAPLVAEGTLRFLGYVPDDELPWLYAGADALCFPSLYEGFGMPVIEAMACGTPVIGSDIPVTREVAGDAALFVPPADPGAWAEAMAWASAADRRGEFQARGRARAASFTFDASARRFLEICAGFDQVRAA